MKFSCEKEILLGLLGTASRAVTGKSSMPLLEGLLICADASTLTVTGYDMSMGIRTTTETDVVEPGSIVINAKLLLDIVRKLPNDVVYIETDDKLMAARCLIWPRPRRTNSRRLLRFPALPGSLCPRIS